MRKIIAFVLIALGLLGIALGLQSCNSIKAGNRRLNRLLKHHPELVRTDTVKTIHYDTIPEVKIQTVFKPDTSTNGLDSIFDAFQGKIDSLMAIKLKGEIHNYIINRPLFPDTITKIIDGVKVKVYQDGQSIGIKIHKPQEIKKREEITLVNNIGKQRYIPTFYQYSTWALWIMLALLAIFLFLRTKISIVKK